MATKKKTAKRREPRVEPMVFEGSVNPIGVDPSWTACAVTALEQTEHRSNGEMRHWRWQVRRAEVIGTKPGDYASQSARLSDMGRMFRRELDLCRGTPCGSTVDLGRPRTCLVAIEGYAMGSKTRPQMAGELCGYLKLLMWQNGVPYLVVPPTTLKKYVTGKGNAPKEVMMMTVLKRWGYEAESNDRADAYALARFAAEFAAGGWTKKFDELAQGCEVVGVRNG